MKTLSEKKPIGWKLYHHNVTTTEHEYVSTIKHIVKKHCI